MLRAAPLALATIASLGAPARAGEDCPERLDPTPFRERMRAIIDAGLSQGTDGAGRGPIEQLDALERLAIGCVDGPIFAADLGSLYLARGMFELDREGGDLVMGRERLVWAAGLGGEGIWSTAFTALRPEYDRALEVAAAVGSATLALDFAEPPDVMVLDGQVEYDMGPREVRVGPHLIQWLAADGWTTARVVLAAGDYQSAPRRGRGELSGDVAAEEPPPPVPAAWVEVGAAGMLYRGQISDGVQVWEGTSGAPAGHVAARFTALDGLLLLGAAASAGQTSSADRPGLGTRLRAEVGAGLGQELRGELLVGASVGALPIALAAETTGGAPGFEGALAAGPQARLRAVVGNPWRLDLALSGAALSGRGLSPAGQGAWAREVGAVLGLERVASPVGPLARVGVGQLALAGLADARDRYTWAVGEVGARWYF